MITDEMVEKAVQASIWKPTRDNIRDQMRAALEAVAPMIITDYLARRTAKAITQELDPK